MNEPWNIADLQSNPQHCFEFLQAHLALCSTLADVVETELTMHDGGAQQAYKTAEDGYAAIARLLVHLRGGRPRSEIRRGLRELRYRLDSLKARLLRQPAKTLLESVFVVRQ